MALSTTQHKKRVLELLLAEWEAAPHLRLGQLISNAIDTRRTIDDEWGPDLFNIEDGALIARINKYVAEAEVAP